MMALQSKKSDEVWRQIYTINYRATSPKFTEIFSQTTHSKKKNTILGELFKMENTVCGTRC